MKDYVCCLSDHGNNFRKVVDPTYKSNRKGTRKPVGYVALCDWVEENFRTFRRPTLEADDCMGILATKPENVGQCIIVSDDKDMKTIPGKLYRPTSDERLDISEADADRFFYTQVLVGDPTDGYKGIPGIGPKESRKILGTRPHWGAVQQAYIKAGMTRDDAIQQASLARILHWEDWHDEIGEVKLWQPFGIPMNEPTKKHEGYENYMVRRLRETEQQPDMVKQPDSLQPGRHRVHRCNSSCIRPGRVHGVPAWKHHQI